MCFVRYLFTQVSKALYSIGYREDKKTTQKLVFYVSKAEISCRISDSVLNTLMEIRILFPRRDT